METLPEIINACPNVHQGASANLFLTLVNALVAAQCKLGPDGRYPADYSSNLKDGDEFDFIVVGAGTAGSIVASRLSEVSQWNVLLLEAGGYPSATTEIPSLYTALQGTSEDWQYSIEASTTCCVGKNRCHYAKGKVLGGSSTINGMHYSRSTKHDHDKWVKAGNVGWDHESIIKHYKAVENVQIEGNDIYGKTGELHLTKYTSSHPLRRTLEKAYEEMGYYEYTEETPIGYKDSLQNIYKGTRQSTAKAFLAPVKERKNLHVAVNVNVDNLLVNHNQKAVLGVELTIGDRRLKIKAKKEVVLSAGSIASPQILMHSGIGPKEHLSKLGIDVIKDLRVGDNFHDHLLLPVIAATLDKTNVPLSTPQDMVDTIYQMFTQRQNDQDITNFASFINTQNKTGFADVEIINLLVPQHEGYILGELKAFGVPKDVISTLQKFNEEAPLLIFILIDLVPNSRGSVRLQNAEPSSQPWVQPNCLSDKHNQDVEVMLDGVKFVQEILKTKAFETFQPKLVDLDIPNCRSFVRQSEDFWRCVVQNLSVPANQHVGTCKMGPLSDSTSVVDSRLRVHGVKGVRVLDASIIPILGSNPFGPSIMVGEKGASMVKEDWFHHHVDL